MRYDPAPASLFVRNREKLTALLEPNSVVVVHANDVLPSNADGTLPFHQNSDLYYLSGIDQEETILVLHPSAPNEKDRELLFVRQTSAEIAIWEGAKLSREQATERSGITQVQWTTSFGQVLNHILPAVENVYLLTNEHARADTTVETRNDRFIKKCRSGWPLHTYKRLAPLVSKLRAVKEVEELEQIQKAIDLTEKGFRRALSFISPGKGEWEVEAEFLHEFVKNRSRGFAYSPIVGSGANACVLHYVENKELMKDGDLVLMDIGAEWAGWNADMTRTVPVNGKFTPRQAEVYNAVLHVLNSANDLLRPGKGPHVYQKEVLTVMTEQLVKIGLLSQRDADEQCDDFKATKRYFMHGTSHHLGLDVHDVSAPDQVFEAGMVMTIEPGIYIQEEGLGIRIENNVVIGEEVNTNLFASFPTTIEEIEKAMAQV